MIFDNHPLAPLWSKGGTLHRHPRDGVVAYHASAYYSRSTL